MHHAALRIQLKMHGYEHPMTRADEAASRIRRALEMKWAVLPQPVHTSALFALSDQIGADFPCRFVKIRSLFRVGAQIDIPVL